MHTHSLVLSIAIGHLSHSADILPEQKFNKGFVVGGGQSEKAAYNIPGERNQLLYIQAKELLFSHLL